MENKNKQKLLEEGIKKFKYRVDYKVNESPRYRPLVSDNEEFDSVPMTNEAGEQEDAPLAQEKEPVEPSNDQPISGTETPVPAFDKGEEEPMDGNPMGVNPMGGDVNAPVEPQVDELQNEIIKHNIEAMKSIHTQLEMLNTTVQGLNSKLAELNADVEEVREPTNTEKLMSKTEVSHPYYYNLNDYWKGNWFNQKREEEHGKGIKELPDGSFIADFDDLPSKSKLDVQNSFNDIF